MNTTPRIAVTTGEPAGIGPDLCLSLTNGLAGAELVILADPAVMAERASALGLEVSLATYQRENPPQAGKVIIEPVTMSSRVIPGHLDPANAGGVLAMLERATKGCLHGEFDAMVTAPLHKGVINDAGIPFTGHTEYLAEHSGSGKVVMMLCTPGLRVALATTHLPLRKVADAIDPESLEQVLQCLDLALKRDFGIARPRILVAGLNPHAGEGGHLGHEDSEIIQPVIERLCATGMHLTGPLPADTLFTPAWLDKADAVLAMYHDQGLPVLKHLGFGRAVNITLGLPFIRTSVDHGTALDLAATGSIHTGSLHAAIGQALEMTARRGLPDRRTANAR